MKILFIIISVLIIIFYGVIYFFQLRLEIESSNGMPEDDIDMDRVRDCFGSTYSDNICNGGPDVDE